VNSFCFNNELLRKGKTRIAKVKEKLLQPLRAINASVLIPATFAGERVLACQNVC
jgi:hypothetical protein